jgi:hypothetical protein
MFTDGMSPRMARALWEGDVEWLSDHFPCECCCAEHTYGNGCPAFQWGGCRGQERVTNEDIKGWAKHYGMTREEFLTGEREISE